MNNIIHYTNCPACNSKNIHYIITAKDFTVSNESFEIWECKDCSLRFTQNIPSAQSIDVYYKSSNYISHSNTNKGIVNKIYHAARNFTLRTKRDLVKNVTGLKQATLLDIGAGTGAFAAFMQKTGWQVTALEPDETARTIGKKNFNINLLPVEEFYKLPVHTFKTITLWHVLEHVHDLHKYLNRLYDLLAYDGKLIIAVPNYTSYDATKYKDNWAAYDVPRHLYHFSPKSMTQLLENCGFSVLQYKPLWLDSFYISLLSEKYKSGKNNFISAFFTGFLSNIHSAKNIKNCSSVIYIAAK